MAIILSKIFAGIMSVVITLSGMFPALFGGMNYIEPNMESASVFQGISVKDIDEALVISDYETAKKHFVTEENEEISEEFFEESNLIIIPVTIPNSACRVFVESVAVKNGKANVSCSVVRDGCIGLTVMSTEIILIAVDKEIEDVSVFEKNVIVPFCIHKSAFSFDV